MFAKPQSEHQWLEQLVGNWTFEHKCQMPDGSTSSTPGKLTSRTIGGLWLVCEGTGETDQGGTWSSIMTIGYDPALKAYVGTFIGSMMTNIWHYRGNLDESQKKLPLDCEGPLFDGSGTTKYCDTIEIIDKDHWRLRSALLTPEGNWLEFMDGLHTRV